MEPIPRLTMFTALKNARIFDDDAWDEDDRPIVKQEVKVEPKDSPTKDEVKSLLHLSHIKHEVKHELDDIYEAEEDDDDSFQEGELADSFCRKSIKQEPSFCNKPVKQEVEESKTSFCNKSIKQEVGIVIKKEDSSSLEEGELEDSFYTNSGSEEELKGAFDKKSDVKTKIKYSRTPPTVIKPDPDVPVDRIFDESPYNKQMFNTLKIKEETPVKNEGAGSSGMRSRPTLKSAKRTVFNRISPYKKTENETYEKRFSAKSRLGPKMDEDDEDFESRPKKRSKQQLETDPSVIARREKQIEYGKNTIGYDNYIRMVPKPERKTDDPKTPPKHIKYSRRGWEGLIKQWRIKLHKYDPPEQESGQLPEESTS